MLICCEKNRCSKRTHNYLCIIQTHTHTTQNPSLSDEYKMTFQFIVYWLRGPTSLHTDELPFCKRKVQRWNKMGGGEQGCRAVIMCLSDKHTA